MDSPQAEETARRGDAPAQGVRGWLADIAAALALLTTWPVAERWQAGAAWPRALRALPLVGAGLGVLGGVVWWLAHDVAGLGALAAALLALLAVVIASGALHEDGLADFADALGGRTREKRLRIMRDARIGGFGVLALIFAVALQVAALLALGQRGVVVLASALVLAHAASRLAAVWLMHALPHARDDGLSVGAGRPDAATLAHAALVVIVGLAVALLTGLLPGKALVAAFVAGNVLAFGFGRLCRWLLGGQTGDAAGAVEVVARCGILLALAAG